VSADRAFRVGERVVVFGGYDMVPRWLQGGSGYTGELVQIAGEWAAVELDEPTEIAGEQPWRDLGDVLTGGSAECIVARGRWLAIRLAYVDQTWEEPVRRIHVAVCSSCPDLNAVPAGAGIGVWVESHASMKHATE
jgi:hypothetical protein